MYRQRSTVLLLSLWLMTILILLCIFVAKSITQKIVFAQKLQRKEKAFYVAYNGLLATIEFLRSDYYRKELDKDPGVFSFRDVVSNYPQFFYKKELNDGEYFSVTYEWEDNVNGDKFDAYGIIDEERKININRASERVLTNLLIKVCGYPYEKAQYLSRAIIDWRDKDNLVTGEEGLVKEDIYYRDDEDKGYPIKNRFFSCIEELVFVKRIDYKVYQKLRPYITVFGDGRININTASLIVLESLGLSDELADKIVYYRAGLDRKEGTSDDSIFSSIDTIIQDLSRYYDLSEEEISMLGNLIENKKIKVNSRLFRAEIVSYIDKNTINGKIISVFNREGKIIYLSSTD